MSGGLSRMGQLPRQDPRTRRNAQRLSGNFDGMLGSGLVIEGGVISLDVNVPVLVDADGVALSYGNGLDVVADELVADVVAPISLGASGISLTYGNGLDVATGALVADVVAPISLGASGIGLTYGNGLTLSGGTTLIVDNTVFIPYSGATADTDLGDYDLTCTVLACDDLAHAGTLLGFYGAALSAKTVIADPGAMQIADNDIAGLTFDASPTQAQCEALRDKCEDLAEDTIAINSKITDLINALQSYGLI